MKVIACTDGELYRKGVDAITSQVRIQCQDGNWNYDSYMHGLANGLICALATLKGEDPKYLEAPPEWLSEKAKRNVRIARASDAIARCMVQLGTG